MCSKIVEYCMFFKINFLFSEKFQAYFQTFPYIPHLVFPVAKIVNNHGIFVVTKEPRLVTITFLKRDSFYFFLCIYLLGFPNGSVRTGHRTTDQFQIGKGVGQGCILSPCLLHAEYHQLPTLPSHFLICVCLFCPASKSKGEKPRNLLM